MRHPSSSYNIERRPMTQILLGTLIAALGAILQWLLWPWISPSHFILLYPTVIISSLLGGLYSGFAANLSSVVLSFYIFFPPAFSLIEKKFQHPLPFLIFMLSGISISVIVKKMQNRTFELSTKKALQSSDQARLSLLENMTIGFAQCEMLFDDASNPVDFIYKDVNSAFESLTGLQNVIGKRVCEIIPGIRTSSPELFKLYARVALGGPSEEIKIYIQELNRWFSVKAYYFGEKNQFAVMFENITNEKLAEEELRKSEERFRFIIEQSPLSIQILDLKGKTIKISKSFEKLWGLSMEDLQNYNMLMDKQLERLGLMPYIKKSFAGEAATLPLREYDAIDTLGKGFKRIVSSVTYPIKDYQGRVCNVVLIHEDVTEKEKAKAAIIEAKEAAENTARLKSHFLDIAAHELRTPITSCSLIVQLAQKQLVKGHSVEESTLARLRTHCERISRLVVDLLDVSRLERNVINLQLEYKNISTLITEQLDDYKLLRPNRKIVFLKPKEQIVVKCDTVRINQVISNFLDNACKYTPDDSPIEISIETMPTFVRVSVKDQGPGISDDQQITLFTPFTRGSMELTGRSGGLGLGLYVSRMIIELHGGRVGLTSKVGHGSTFYFEIPTSIGDQKI